MHNEIVGFCLQGSPVAVEAWDLVLKNAQGEPVGRLPFSSFEAAAEAGCSLFPEPAPLAQVASL